MKLSKYKDKERILKAARDKRSLTYKDRHIRLAADLSTETWWDRREWQEVLNMLEHDRDVHSHYCFVNIALEVLASAIRQQKAPKFANKKSNFHFSQMA